MKILKIESNIGSFSTDGENYKNINEITRNDIFSILMTIIENSEGDTEFDLISDENVILNEAQKAIYEKIYSKLTATVAKREDILASVTLDIKPILEKYEISLDE